MVKFTPRRSDAGSTVEDILKKIKMSQTVMKTKLKQKHGGLKKKAQIRGFQRVKLLGFANWM